MNGVASAHARQTEDYRVNWGVELPRLAKISDEIVESKAWGGFSEEDSLRTLAQALWNESTRECKILACMLMPVEDFVEELCDIWAETEHEHTIIVANSKYFTSATLLLGVWNKNLRR